MTWITDLGSGCRDLLYGVGYYREIGVFPQSKGPAAEEKLYAEGFYLDREYSFDAR